MNDHKTVQQTALHDMKLRKEGPSAIFCVIQHPLHGEKVTARNDGLMVMVILALRPLAAIFSLLVVKAVYRIGFSRQHTAAVSFVAKDADDAPGGPFDIPEVQGMDVPFDRAFAAVICDCSEYEKRVLLHIVSEAKIALQKNAACFSPGNVHG